MILVGIFGVLGALLRYYISEINISILLINIIAVVLLAFTYNISDNNKKYFHTGFLGGFSSISAIIIINNNSIIYLLINVISCFIIYFVLRKILKGCFHVHI